MPIRHIGTPPSKRFDEIKKIIKNIPVKAANTALNYFKDSFVKESWDGKAWAKRSKWSTNDRKILYGTRTPHLYDSLMKAVNGNHIKCYVAPPASKYADTHNFGATIVIPANAKTEKWAWAMFYKEQSATGKGFYKSIALKMKSGQPMRVKIPQRQFIGNSPILNTKIQKKIESELEKINKL